MDVIRFQKIFGLCGLKCHIVEIWRDVTFEDNGRTKCKDRARNLETEFAILFCCVGHTALARKGREGRNQAKGRQLEDF